MKRTLVWMESLALVFAILATLVAPAALGWYFTPPEGGMVMMKGDDAVRWGTHRLIEAQLVALIAGALLGLFIGARSRSKTAEPLPPPRAGTPPAPTARV